MGRQHPARLTTRDAAEALDGADPLAAFRDRFVIPDPDRIYLDGNSLGRLSIDARSAIEAATEEWAASAVEGWERWIELPARVGDRLASVVLGAQPGEVLVADSVTVNLFKLAHAAADLRDGPFVTTSDNFPTDRYVLEGVARQRGRTYVEADTADEAMAAARGGILCLSHVDYRSGRRLDLAGVTASADAIVIWDLSHSAGAIEIDLSSAQMAVGCTYKYLNAGPGAPAFAYVRGDLIDRVASPIQGWFGRRDQFAMPAGYEPAMGIERLLAGTPPILPLTAVEAGVALIEEAGVARIAAKGRALTELAIDLADAWLEPLGFDLVTPRTPAGRGAHIALRHADGWRIARALRERSRVVPDFRPPDLVRLGFSPLTTRFVDAWDGLDRLRTLVEAREHRTISREQLRVT